MFVETMTLEQIRVEIERCNTQARRRVVHIFNDPSYRRVCLKLKPVEYREFKMIDFACNGFKFHFVPNTYGKHDYKKRGISILTFVTFLWKGSLWSASIEPFGTRIEVKAFYTPHFFDRYAERLGLTGSLIDIMKRFHLNNKTSMATRYENDNHEDSVFITLDEGTGFGTWFNGYVLFKTFIRDDMLFEDQMDLYNSGVSAMQRYMSEAV